MPGVDFHHPSPNLSHVAHSNGPPSQWGAHKAKWAQRRTIRTWSPWPQRKLQRLPDILDGLKTLLLVIRFCFAKPLVRPKLIDSKFPCHSNDFYVATFKPLPASRNSNSHCAEWQCAWPTSATEPLPVSPKRFGSSSGVPELELYRSRHWDTGQSWG